MSAPLPGARPIRVGPLRALVATVVALLALFLGATAWLGGFLPVVVVERETGPFTFAYREMGDADLARANAISRDLVAALADVGVAATPMAVFYADALEGRRPNEAGVRIAAASADAARALADAPRVREIAPRPSMTLSLPGGGGLSYVVGYFRAESALGRYRDVHRYRRTSLLVLVGADRNDYVQPIVANDRRGAGGREAGAAP